MAKVNKYNAVVSKFKPRTRIRFWVWLSIIITLVAGFLVYPNAYNTSVGFLNNKLGLVIPNFPSIPFHLGLDLQGGTQLVYEADLANVPNAEKSDSVEGVRDVIERRVNAFGVAEPLVQTNKVGDSYRIIAELAGVKDIKEAIKMIGETPLLEFKEEYTGSEELTAEQQKEMDQANATAKTDAQKKLSEALKAPADFKGEDIGYVTKESNEKFFTPASEIKAGEVYWKVIETDEGFNIIKRGEYQKEEQVKANHILICYKGAASCTSELSKEDALKKIQELKTQATVDNFVQLAKDNSTEPGAAESGGDLGFFSQGQMVEAFGKAAFALKVGEISDVVETDFGYHLIYRTDERFNDSFQIFRELVKKKTKADYIPADKFKATGLSGKNLKKAALEFNQQSGELMVALTFNEEGKTLFAEITERNINKLVAIYLDGQAISTPRVQEAIKDGQAVIMGKFSEKEAKTLVRRLNSGALPVPIKLISQQTIGASLGQDSMDKSIKAGFVGLLLIILFMIGYYRLPGLISCIALLIYGVIVLALFKLIPVVLPFLPITLTLSGIAGFVLSIGMAVDANVLIFERTKEELTLGKPLGTAIEEGFRRAWPSIRDGNFTTLLTCLILMWFGSGLIRGFAITLGIGILISMLTALVVTRVWMKLVAGWKPFSTPSWLYLYKKPKL